MTTWTKKPVYDTNKVSVVFSWDLWKLTQTKQEGLIVGGPAVKANPQWIPNWMTVGPDEPFLHKHNALAMRTSLGCVRNCPFCIVPKIEGPLQELDVTHFKPIVIDNNLLACSQKHFDKVIDGLKTLEWCDFNQGLDPRLLTDHHAERFAELAKPVIRLSFDSLSVESAFVRAYETLRRHRIPKRCVQVYVLIGFRDTPEDALYRLSAVRKLGLLPNPMRYQPIDAKKKNEYVGPGWSAQELTRYMRYWARLRFTSPIPFAEFA